MEKKKESRSGMEIMNLLQVSTIHIVLNVACNFQDCEFCNNLVFMMCINRRKGGNVEHGMGRKLTMIFIKRLYASFHPIIINFISWTHFHLSQFIYYNNERWTLMR